MSNKLLPGILLCGVTLMVCGAIVCSKGETGRPSQKSLKHVVEKGDTVWEIARKYGVKPEGIIEINKLEKPYKILPGQVLTIPRATASAPGASQPVSKKSGTHIVQKGDTVWGIARTYGVEPDEIIEINKLKKPFLIFPGQVLVIPGLVSPEARQQEIASLCRLPRGVRARRWRYIVIHHSGTRTGNAAIFDRNHRMRGMKNGLAYHFVIGNGKGSADGEIEVGGRWTRQLHGGHCRNQKVNEVGIGVCLVGNFEKTYPTRRQMESLVLLARYLCRKYSIPKRRVIGHKNVRGSPTDCPGKNFSLEAVRRKL